MPACFSLGNSFMKKAMLSVLALFVAFMVAGVTGLLFRIWPTSIPDSRLNLTPQIMDELKSFRATPKFKPDSQRYYPGAPNESTRLLAEEAVNQAVDQLLSGLPAKPQKSFVLSTFKQFLPWFKNFDSEEKDEALYYLRGIRGCLFKILYSQCIHQLRNDSHL
jgi:hypothetical protein